MSELQTGKCLEFFSEILNVLKTTNQHERVFHFVVDRLVRLFKCQACAIILIDRNTEYLNVENSHGVSWTFCKAFRRKFATGVIGELLWTGKPILIRDSDLERQLADEVMLEHPFGSCLCVQIAMNQRTLGYLHAESKEKGAFGEEDIGLLQTFADIAGVALYKNQLYEENLRLDRIDHETDLEKYSPFLERLTAAYENSRSSEEPFSVLILDVDNYKQIVNTYGYDASRQFLKELGGLVKSQLSVFDAGGRFGPDEIIMVLGNTSMEEAVGRAKAIRKSVEETRFTKREIATSISIGVSAYPQNGKALDDVVLTAKKALFEAQRGGRNKVYHYLAEWYAKEPVLLEE
jgi:diguanylate cyclase (GGDEF)-like protein